ncbi:MAG: hypothetical protein V8Q82_02700 [Christensenellales bacterium]
MTKKHFRNIIETQSSHPQRGFKRRRRYEPSLFCFSLRRAGALLLSILLILCQLPFAALASDAQPPVLFSLAWTEGDVAQQQLASEVTASGYEGSYWLYVPAAALQADAVLHVQDVYGQYAALSIADGTPLSQLSYMDAGTELNMSYLDVLAYDAAGQQLARAVPPVYFHPDRYARYACARAD